MKYYLFFVFSLLFGFQQVSGQTYCTGGGPTSAAWSELESVTLNGQSTNINYLWDCNATVTGLLDRTATHSADLVVGNPYTVTVNYGSCSGNWTNMGTVYIDFDGDGVFSPAEAVGTASAQMTPFSGVYSFTVPPSAVPGTTRMRVIQDETGSKSLPLDPCATFTWGTMVDFEIVIIPSGPCTSATVTAANASSGLICVGDSVNLSATGVSFGTGTIYQWQSSPDSVNWTNMAGPTNLVNRGSGALATTTYFRLQVTCGATTVSSPGVKVEVTGTPLPGGTYTINSALATGGTNFASFGDFTSAIFCGGVAGPVIVNVAAGSGPYIEQVVFDNINTTSTNTITINGNGETVELNTPVGTVNNRDRSVFVIESTSFITIDNLTIKADVGFTAAGVGLLISGASNNIVLKNATVDFNIANINFNSTAVLITSNTTSMTLGGSTAANNITIEDNTIIGGYNGISIHGSSNASRGNGSIIRRNIIKDFYIYGLYSRNQDNFLVTENDFSRPTRTSLTSFYAMFFTGEHAGNIISKNSIHDAFVANKNTSLIYAVYMSSASGTAANPNYMFNNRLYNLDNNGTFYGIWNATSSHWKYYHNSMHVDDNGPTGGLTRAIYLSGNSDGVDFVNNVISVSRSGTSMKHLVYILGTGTRTFNNNGYFTNYALAPNTSRFGFIGTDRNTFADWVTNNGNGWDNNSVFDNPDFAGTTTGLLRPAAGAMNDMGQNLLSIVPTDFFDTARTITPDPGAFEFDPPACPRPSVNISSTVDTSSVLNWVSGIAGGTYNIEWGPAGFNRGTGFTQTITGDSVQLNGLAPNTCYDIYVQLDCTGAGNGFSLWSFVFTWCTNCAAFTPPYFEGFENWTLGNLPDVLESCYNYNSTSTLRWQVQTGGTPSANTGPLGGAVGSNQYLFLNTSFGINGDEASLTFPAFNLNGMTSPEVRFFYHMFGAGIGTLRVEASTNLGVTWDSLWSITGQQQTSSAATYNDVSVSLAAYNTSSNVLVRFVGTRTATFTGNIAIDNITIDEAPQCPPPSFPMLLGATATTSNINWNAGGGLLTRVSFGPVGFVPANGTIANTVDTFFTVAGLTPQTSYEVYIQDSCSDGTLSPWIGPLAFTTACVAVTMPYFEDYSVWPNSCWSYNTGTFVWEPFTTGGVNYAQARFWSFNSSNPPAVMTTVPINITTDAQIRYSWSRNTSTFYTDSLYVLSRIAGTAAWDTLKAFGDPNFGVPGAANTAPAPAANFQEELHYLPSSYVGNAAEFRFVAVTNFGPNVYMDFFTVEAQPACPDPTQLVANSIAPTSVNLGWNQAGS
ncbi:MAG: GEVED domain-containing protein, partial [Schleiferiaceae bacterium]|nr:GEVED domain-containing protein [Schleiferiaceae bacterium]